MTINHIQPELEKGLKVLGLSGMQNSLPERNQEAIANQLSYSEFLGLLIQDELLAKEHRRFQRRHQNARFKGNKTIENFDFSFNPKINQALIRDLMTCRFIREKQPVLIMGPCGTGKSHLAQAIGQAAVQKGFDVLCTTQTQLSEALQVARATNAYTKKIKALAKIALLIIDDFGLKPLHSPQDEDLHELISERYEQTSTVVTSNLTLDEWVQAFPNKLLGVAIIDRLRQSACQLTLEGKSYRAQLKK
jgi:DNA replication protein DnaC